MLRFGLVFALALCVGSVAAQQDAGDYEQFHVIYEWFKLDYKWPDDSSKARALTSQQYIPENNAISGIKVHGNRLYLTVPRYKEGVPATLVSIPVMTPDRNASPRLEPFPSWEMQEIGNCSALQFVQNVEIDIEGRMWVLDSGRINIMNKNEPKCPPKLLIIDLNSVSKTSYSTVPGSTASYPSSFDSSSTPSFANVNVMNGTSARVVRTFQFPDSLASGIGSYLVDIVLDPTDGGFAYISDGGDADPGIIVYSFLENRAWKVRDNNSMVADRSAKKFSINGRPAEIIQNLSPMAADLKKGQLFYSPLTSLHMYSIPTSLLRDSSRASDASKSIVDMGKKLGLSQGFAMDEHGVLYYGLIDDNGIAKWDTTTSIENGQHVISKDAVRLQWPTNLGFDENGYLWVVTNRLHNYIAGRVNLSEANYRVIRGLTRTKSYLHAEGIGSSDEWTATKSTDTVENNTSKYSADSKNENSGAAWTSVTPVALLGAVIVAKIFT